jgi:hypothetical protein
VTTDSTRTASSVLNAGSAMSETIWVRPKWVAKVDEQQVAVIALAVDPARQLHALADVALAELAAAMGTIGVHRKSLSKLVCWLKGRASASLHSPCFVKRSGAK